MKGNTMQLTAGDVSEAVRLLCWILDDAELPEAGDERQLKQTIGMLIEVESSMGG